MKDLSKVAPLSVQEKSMKVALPFMVVSALFAGFALGIIFILLPDALSGDNNDLGNTAQVQTSQPDLLSGQFQDVYDILQTTYINDLPADQEIEYGLIKGLISSLDDEYTNFLTPEEAEVYLDSRVEDFEGIGVTLAFDGDFTYVETVLEGNPAFTSGLLPGDLILEVDGEDVAGEIPQLVASRIRGEKGTDVMLTIFRENEQLGESLDFAITRDTIIVDNIMWNTVEENYAEIDISQFNAETPEDFITNWDEVVDEITNEVDDLQGVIIDLRNNPGGYVSGVRHVMEEFFTMETVLYGEQSKSLQTVTYRDGRMGEFEDVEVVILVNEGSASASEILSAGIQDNERGTIIGMPTVGKGVEQIIVDDFEDGSLFIITFQRWLTPSGRSITKEDPIIPDIEVDYTNEDFQNGEDPQFDAALEELKK